MTETPEFPWPIAILGFSRPHYLSEVLKSLKCQSVKIDPRKVALVLDGYRSRITGGSIVSGDLVVSNIEIFKSEYPEGRIVFDEMNYGIALNFNRAETLIFEELGQAAGVFLEDDLTLGFRYMEVLQSMLSFALQQELVSYVACYGDHRKTLAEQLEAPGKIVRMGHKWAFGLTRRQYLAQAEFVNGYLNIVKGREYKDRDHVAIKAYFEKYGYSSYGSSQDAAKDVASYMLGRVKIMTQACFGRYIGKEGLHATERFYNEQGFQNTELMTQWPIDLIFPDLDQLKQWVRSEQDTGVFILRNHQGT